MAASTAARPATTDRPRRTAASRGGRNHTARIAYDLGRAGEDAPDWIGDNDTWADAYERGVSDRDAAVAGARRHHDEDDDRGPVDEQIDDSDANDAHGNGVVISITGRRSEDVLPDDKAQQRRDREQAQQDNKRVPWGQRQITTVAGHSISLAALPLGMFAYAAMVNVLQGTFKQWLSAKLTNGQGSLP